MDRPDVELRFAAKLRLFLAPRHRCGQLPAACDATPSLGHVVESLGVPLPEVGRLVVNGQLVPPSYRPGAGDVVQVLAVRRRNGCRLRDSLSTSTSERWPASCGLSAAMPPTPATLMTTL